MTPGLVAIVPPNAQCWGKLGHCGEQTVNLSTGRMSCTERRPPTKGCFHRKKEATGIPSGLCSTLAAVMHKSYFLLTPACVLA